MSKFKKGDRVVLLRKPSDRREGLARGSVGTVAEYGSRMPYVRWDNENVGVWAVMEKEMELLQESTVAAGLSFAVERYQDAVRAADAAEQARKDALAALVAHIEEEARK